MDAPGAVDLDRVLREIDAEVRALRRSGEIPADLERQLDELFARHAPAAVSDDFDAVIDQAERDVGLSYAVPTESRLPAGGFVKRLVARAVGWYVLWFVRQLSGLASTIVRAVRLLARRVDRLEAAAGVGDDRLRAAAAAVEAPLHGEWAPRLAELLAGVDGRVLVTDAGSGEHLAALVRAGFDAYGAVGDLAAVDALADAGFDARHAAPIEHLRRLPDGALAAVVLVGCPETSPRGERIELAHEAVRVVAPGGCVVVVSSTPAGRARAVGVVRADLTPAAPFHAPTWEHLLRAAGCGTTQAHLGADVAALAPTGSGPVDDNFARIAAVLFSPSSYAVVARRG